MWLLRSHDYWFWLMRLTPEGSYVYRKGNSNNLCDPSGVVRLLKFVSEKISKDSSPGSPGEEWHRFKVDVLGQRDVGGFAANIPLLFYTDYQSFRPEEGIFIELFFDKATFNQVVCKETELALCVTPWFSVHLSETFFKKRQSQGFLPSIYCYSVAKYL